MKDALFDTSRSVLAARRKQLKSQGLGNKPNRADPISDDVELLWDTGALGTHNAVSLMNTVCFLNTELLGLRGSHDSRLMLWGDLEEENRATAGGGTEKVLVFTERVSKMRQGDKPDVRKYPPVMYPNYEMPERCPIRAFNLYKSQRPP